MKWLYIDKTRNYLIEEINLNKPMSKRHKKVCATINYRGNIVILASTITGCVSISAFAPLAGISIGITSSAKGLKICARTAGIVKYKSIIKKKKMKHHKIALLAKSELNAIEVFISKALIDLVIIYNEFVLITNIHKEYNEMKKEIKKS